MKLVKIIAGLLFATIIGVGIYLYFDSRNFYGIGENGNYQIKVGERFEIKLVENPTTGHITWWINQDSCRCVKLVSQIYKADRHLRDCIGCGGTATLTFEGIEKGTDTISIGKYFNDHNPKLRKHNSLPLNRFAVTVQ